MAGQGHPHADRWIALHSTATPHYRRFVTLVQYVLLGAAGGGLVEVLEALSDVLVWKQARRTPGGRVKATPPRARIYIDLPGHAVALLMRLPLGAAAAWAFSGQISGPYAALAFGFAAPSVLAQLSQFPAVREAVRGGNRQDEVSPERVATAPKAASAQSSREVGQA
jgi:hypothetical protein